jgi:glycosyltransferase involved in cell wall biosynthesis
MITLSIVSGTYNRLSYLRNMVNSARLALPAGISYEFVIVDAGSTDGTLEWLAEQSDIRVIEHGEKLGAIKAFCDGANAARGKYVLMANDDISFMPHSITRAIAYLEDTASCGGVAFQDDRPVRGYGGGFKTQAMAAINPSGRECVVTYAQVGLFPKWLGDKAGWWGDDDAIMGESWTYGGDNYLSARIWELGYSIDEVAGCAVKDHIPQDQLRIENTASNTGSHPDSDCYNRRFPSGPQINGLTTYDTKRQMRILYLPIYEPGNEHQRLSKRGLRQALKRVGLVYEVDYLNGAVDIAQIVKAWQPDLMLCQLQDASNVPPATLAFWRTLAPQMAVVNWHGDARGLLEPEYIELLQHVDLQLVVNAAPLEEYKALDIQAAYWQIGFEEPAATLPNVARHDIVFLGNCYSEERKALENVVRANGYNAGLYGAGWEMPDGNTLYDFAAGKALYKRATIAVSDTFPGQKAFVSNRLFQALAAGAFVLQQDVPELQTYTGLKEGSHYVGWSDLADLESKLYFWLDESQRTERNRIRRNGRNYVEKHYTFDAQVNKLFFELLPMVEA